MNKVISGYFDSAHRGLQRQQQEGLGPDGIGMQVACRVCPGERISASGSAVQLPPLRDESHELSKEGHSKSFGSLVEFTSEQAQMGVQYDKYQQVLQDNANLMKKLRMNQEQLAITSAKKEAFRAQAQRLEKEFKKGRDQSEALQKDLLEAIQTAVVIQFLCPFGSAGSCSASEKNTNDRAGSFPSVVNAMLSALKAVFKPAERPENLTAKKNVKLQDVKAEDYPTPDKYLEGAEIPTFYQFQSNMVADEDLKAGMASGLEVDKRLTLPTRTHIRFLVTGQDVIHSWSIPSLGIKTDATPGRINRAPRKLGIPLWRKHGEKFDATPRKVKSY
eukprot:s1830_g1.t1